MEPSPRRSKFRLVAQGAALSLVAALLGLLVWDVASGSGTALVSQVRAGAKPRAPAFDLPVIWDERQTWAPVLQDALDDMRVTRDELRGYPVVINFWASWCKPCEKEAPELAASARAHAREVAFLGIDVQDFTSDARRFLRRTAAPYPSVKDAGNGTYQAFGLTGVPETFYLDAKGRIVEHSLGQISRRELEDKIAAVLSRMRS